MAKEMQEIFGAGDSAAPEAQTPEVEMPTAEAQTAADQPVVTPPADAPPSEPVRTSEAPAVPPGFVPVQEVQRLRQRLREIEQAQAASEPAEMPDMIAYPEAYTAAVQAQIQQATLNATLNMSEAISRRHYGAETVDAAKNWAIEQFAINPALRAQVLSQPDPYGYLVEQWKRDQALSKLGSADLSEIEQFRAWKAAQAQLAQQQPAAPAATPQPATTPPKGIATASNAAAGDGSLPKPDPIGDRMARIFGVT
ncbi:MAG: hypothetical protein SNJ62_04890 [Chloracidobacterium sp.]